MQKERLIGFSDGYLAIVITLMVLEIKIPSTFDFGDLFKAQHSIMSYFVSYLFISIYWINHHHLFQVVKKVNVKILWANLNFLFWISLLPFATGWLGESEFKFTAPISVYSILIFITGFSYKLLIRAVLNSEGKNSLLSQEIGKDIKGILTGLINFIAVIISFYSPIISFSLLCLVAIAWFIPDKRVEKTYYNILDKK